MTRRGLVITAAITLLIISFSHPGYEVYGQSRTSGTDTIRFVGAKQGVNYDGSPLGEAWCWVTQPSPNGTGWHGFWVSNAEYTNPARTQPVFGNALDEVAQSGPYVQGAAFQTYCPSVDPPGSNTPLAPQVEFRVYGNTDNPQCTILNPCPSLRVLGTTGTYSMTSCTFIEADLYDWATWGTGSFPDGTRSSSADWKGKSRMLHATSPGPWSTTIQVASDGWSPIAQIVGQVHDDHTVANPCSTQYHVHHDFKPSTTGQSCLLTKNTGLASTSPLSPSPNQSQTGKRRQDPNANDWVHSLVHQFDAPCYDLGGALADILMGPGGMLNQANVSWLANCTVTRCSLETPQPVTLPGTSWKGYVVVDDSVLRGAKCVDMGFSATDCLRALAEDLPSSGNTAHFFRYGPDTPGYYFQVWWVTDNYPGRAGDCVSLPNVVGYWVDFKNFAQIQCNAQSAGAIPNPNAPGVTSYGWWVDACCGLPTTWSQYQGAGGLNPPAIKNMPSSEWRQWAQNLLNTGNWPTLQSRMITVMRAAHGWHALAQIEIRADSSIGPDFECSNMLIPDNPSTDFSEPCRQYYP
jgi:hypothetical protein